MQRMQIQAGVQAVPKRKQPSYMSTAELKSLCKRFDLTTDTLADFARIHPRTAARWLNGEYPIDARTTMLFRLMTSRNIPLAVVAVLLER